MKQVKFSLKRGSIYFFILASILALSACGGGAPANRETLTTGTIRVSADESFKPVIDSQVKVFEAQHPGAKIIVDYKPEAECLRDLTNDSVRMVIVTRGLSKEEERLMTDKYQFKPRFGSLALDAVAVIVNNKATDSTFKMSDLEAMVRGTSTYKYKVLLDGTSATSTVRFVRDSIIKGENLSKNVVAAADSRGVIEYVSKHNDAIGMIGVSWIGNREDSSQLSFLESVKLAQIECRGCTGSYVQPYQANIAMKRYPMVRPLYYILKENFEGLGSGFANFLIYEKGQLIFSRSYLLPTRMQFDVRSVNISEE
jgi:phosphate transport system substrate-binding protein